MKKIYLSAGLCALFLIGAGIFSKPAEARINGSNIGANYSGITSATCNTSGCHTGTALNGGPGNVAIVTNIPGTGYAPGTTYSIEVTVSAGGANGAIFGFCCSAAKNGTSTVTGGFAAADNTTLIKSGGNYIVHNAAAAGSGINDSHTFTFNWTAPVGGTGAVQFFATGNSGNGNSGDSGDQIYSTNIVVNEMPGFGLTESVISAFNLYPNPAVETVNVKVPESLMDSQVRLLDITGKTIISQQLNQSTVAIDINTIPQGLYIVEVVKDGKSYTSKLIKK